MSYTEITEEQSLQVIHYMLRLIEIDLATGAAIGGQELATLAKVLILEQLAEIDNATPIESLA